MPSTREVLNSLVKVEGIASAVVVGRDGFVIDAAGGAGMDVEAVGAVISTGFGSSETMGQELKIGKMGQVMAEFDNGVLVSAALGQDAILAIVTSASANLGNVRYQVKKHIKDLEKSL
ncbi:MAG: roadblock/LC7 domain-containing protein [Acidobacteriota bacterium]